ncbi:MAG: 6-bladed beta-propeller [Elusimicrobiales bacterium]|jgi:DNA-binding beta-propeller fold protein YncE
MRKFQLLAVLLAVGPDLSAYEKIEFKSQISNPALIKLSAVAVMDGKILAADSKANAVFVFDAEGKLLKKSSVPLKEPNGLSAGNGKIYVADTGNSRIAVLDASGSLLWAFSSEGSLPGQLDAPMDVVFGPDGRVYAADTGNSRVEVFNSDGIFLYGFPVMKSDNLTKLNPGRIAVDNAGFIYVADPGNSLIVKYDRTGHAVKEYAFDNDGAVVDAYGVLYVINGREGKVREISASGEILGTFGTRGKGKSEFLKLRGIAIDSSGVLYLADEGNKKIASIRLEGEHPEALPHAQPIDRFNLKGPVKKYAYRSEVFAVRPDLSVAAYLPETREVVLVDTDSRKTVIMRSGAQQGQAKNPRGMASDPKGQLYISDTGNGRVQIFNADGTYANLFGEEGSKEGKFSDPAGIAVNLKGVIYVADTGNRRVQAFNSDGIFLFSIGPVIGNINLRKPVGVRTDRLRNLYILDSDLKKVIVTDANGKFLRVWDDSGLLQDPISIGYDGMTYFYILDRGAYSVKIFDEQGKFISSFFSKGPGEREFMDPQYMEIADNKVYVADRGAGKILAFALSYMPEEPTGLKCAADETRIVVSWQAAKTPWLKNFVVYRADSENGDYRQIGMADKSGYADSSLASDTTYYYSVAGVSVTGDIGARSAPLAGYFKGAAAVPSGGTGPASVNVAPMEIVPVELSYIFSANYKYYMKNPIGRIAVQNNTDAAFSNVKVSFFLKDFMDFPSDTIVPEIAPKSRAEVDLKATLNNRILNINEDTPIQCQLTMTYYQDGAEKTFTLNKPVKVLSKNAIIWDKAARLANFITPKDTPVFGFSRFVLNEKSKYQDGSAGESSASGLLNENVLSALMIWEGLGEVGLSYLADPVNPYSVKKSSREFTTDTVQFPRNTLKLRSGDCDDLTALFASLFEAAGLHTALLDYPSHIALMFDTGVTDAREAGIPEEYLIKYNNTYWAGVETTMVGKDFYNSIKHEADLYRSKAAEVKVADVRTSWAEFEPVTLPETEAESNPDRAKFNAGVKEAVAVMLKARYDYFRKYYGAILLENPDDADANLNLGILSAQYGEAEEAAKDFGKILEKDPVNAAALNDMGNLSFKAGKYQEAGDYYFKAAKSDPYDANVWLNAARAAAKLDKKDDVKAFADRAAQLDPEVKNIGDKLLK